MSQQPEPRQLTREEKMAEMLKHKQRMMPLIRFLKKRGLKFKHASCNRTRVEYFRMDHFRAIIEEKQEEIDRNAHLSQLVKTIEEDLIFFKRPPNTEKLRYPQVLMPSQTGTGKFACFKFDTTESRKLYVIILVAIIFAGVMFPLWPYELKYGLWLLSVFLLVTLIGIILLRLILYVIFASFGVSFWMFPNMFGDYGVVESFKPFYSIQKWDNDIVAIILRIAAFAIFMYYSISIYQEPQFYAQNLQITKQTIRQFHDWGVGKIKGEAGNFSQRALTMDKILNETADAFEEETPQNIDTQTQQEEKQQQQTQQQDQNQEETDTEQIPEQEQTPEQQTVQVSGL